MPDDAPQTTPQRDEARIRFNLTRYLEAASEHGQHQWRARCAKEEMDKALRDLRAAGGEAEVARYATHAR